MTKHNRLQTEYQAAQKMQDELTLLEQRLGYRFKDRELLVRAITHSSTSDDNYENMEFRGDKIMAFILSEIINHRYPEYDARDRTEVIDAMVCNNFLREKIAAPLGIASFMIIDANKNTDPKVISDCIESLICAIYDDGGVKEAAKFIDKHWQPHFEYKSANDEPVMRLTQYFNEVGMTPHPKYSVYKRHGGKAEIVLTIPPHGAQTEAIEVTAMQENAKQGYINPSKRRLMRNKMALEALGKLGIATLFQPKPESPTA